MEIAVNAPSDQKKQDGWDNHPDRPVPPGSDPPIASLVGVFAQPADGKNPSEDQALRQTDQQDPDVTVDIMVNGIEPVNSCPSENSRISSGTPTTSMAIK